MTVLARPVPELQPPPRSGLLEPSVKVTATPIVLDQSRGAVIWGVDPITLERCSDAEAVVLSGTKFGLRTLVKWLSDSTTETRLSDPVTRVPLTEDELRLIDAKAKALGLETRLSDIAQVEEAQGPDSRSRRRCQSAEIATLEALVGEVVSELFDLVEEDSRASQSSSHWSFSPFLLHDVDNEEEMDATLKMAVLFSCFAEPFCMLKMLSLESAKMALEHHLAFIKGPPPRPSANGPRALLSASVDFLAGMWTEADSAKLLLLRARCSPGSAEEPA